MSAHSTRGVVVSAFDASAVSDADPSIRYAVDATDGFVNASQADKHGQDVLVMMTPTDARWLATKILNAADVAEGHARWAREKGG